MQPAVASSCTHLPAASVLPQGSLTRAAREPTAGPSPPCGAAAALRSRITGRRLTPLRGDDGRAFVSLPEIGLRKHQLQGPGAKAVSLVHD